jgi:hypothetical protein
MMELMREQTRALHELKVQLAQTDFNEDSVEDHFESGAET